MAKPIEHTDSDRLSFRLFKAEPVGWKTMKLTLTTSSWDGSTYASASVEIDIGAWRQIVRQAVVDLARENSRFGALAVSEITEVKRNEDYSRKHEQNG